MVGIVPYRCPLFFGTDLDWILTYILNFFGKDLPHFLSLGHLMGIAAYPQPIFTLFSQPTPAEQRPSFLKPHDRYHHDRPTPRPSPAPTANHDPFHDGIAVSTTPQSHRWRRRRRAVQRRNRFGITEFIVTNHGLVRSHWEGKGDVESLFGGELFW